MSQSQCTSQTVYRILTTRTGLQVWVTHYPGTNMVMNVVHSHNHVHDSLFDCNRNTCLMTLTSFCLKHDITDRLGDNNVQVCHNDTCYRPLHIATSPNGSEHIIKTQLFTSDPISYPISKMNLQHKKKTWARHPSVPHGSDGSVRW